MNSPVGDHQYDTGQHSVMLPSSFGNEGLFEADPLIGQIIDDRYQIVRTIGTGSWSRVYQAKELKSNSLVALKILNPVLVSNAEIVARFRREAESGMRLNHSGICAVYGFGTLPSGQPYIAMECVDGETLADKLRRSTRLALDEAVPIFIECCDALQHAHAEQIIHRDIKPGNILISTNGRIKLLDFGLAKFIADGEKSLTQAGTALGTVRYLSPEQALGESVDTRSDLYSLACVLYESLTGVAVFDGTSAFDVINQHVHRTPPRLKELHPACEAIPDSIEALILKALSKDPQQRVQSADEFKELLLSVKKRRLCLKKVLLIAVTCLLLCALLWWKLSGN